MNAFECLPFLYDCILNIQLGANVFSMSLTSDMFFFKGVNSAPVAKDDHIEEMVSRAAQSYLTPQAPNTAMPKGHALHPMGKFKNISPICSRNVSTRHVYLIV